MRPVRQRIGGGLCSANMAATAARWAASRVLPCACSCARLGATQDTHHQPCHALLERADSPLFAFGSVMLARTVVVFAHVGGLGDSVSATSHGCALGGKAGAGPRLPSCAPGLQDRAHFLVSHAHTALRHLYTPFYSTTAGATMTAT